jgi:hypothetical protein
LKTAIALILSLCSFATLGDTQIITNPRLDPKFALGADWMAIPTGSIDQIYIDKLNLITENNRRKYWVLINTSTFRIETDCEKLESKFLKMEMRALRLNGFNTETIYVKDSFNTIAKYACEL